MVRGGFGCLPLPLSLYLGLRNKSHFLKLLCLSRGDALLCERERETETETGRKTSRSAPATGHRRAQPTGHHGNPTSREPRAAYVNTGTYTLLVLLHLWGHWLMWQQRHCVFLHLDVVLDSGGSFGCWRLKPVQEHVHSKVWWHCRLLKMLHPNNVGSLCLSIYSSWIHLSVCDIMFQLTSIHYKIETLNWKLLAPNRKDELQVWSSNQQTSPCGLLVVSVFTLCTVYG